MDGKATIFILFQFCLFLAQLLVQQHLLQLGQLNEELDERDLLVAVLVGLAEEVHDSLENVALHSRVRQYEHLVKQITK